MQLMGLLVICLSGFIKKILSIIPRYLSGQVGICIGTLWSPGFFVMGISEVSKSVGTHFKIFKKKALKFFLDF